MRSRSAYNYPRNIDWKLIWGFPALSLCSALRHSKPMVLTPIRSIHSTICSKVSFLHEKELQGQIFNSIGLIFSAIYSIIVNYVLTKVQNSFFSEDNVSSLPIKKRMGTPQRITFLKRFIMIYASGLFWIPYKNDAVERYAPTK